MSHPIFMDLNPICCYVSPKIVIFHEPLIVGTCNKCHWIWHASNLKYAPLKQFQCIFPSQNQQNVKFLSEIVIFSGTTYCRDSKAAVALDLAYVKPYMCATQAISMHLSQSKSTKCEIFVWYCNFLGTTYHRDMKPAVLDLACLKPYICATQAISILFFQSKSTNVNFSLFPELPLTTYWLNKINPFFSSQNQQMWIFHCFLNFDTGKEFSQSFHKDLQICTYRFLGMPIAMHFVTTLCDKYFLSYYGFSAFVMGRSRYWVLKHGVRVKCDPRRTAAYVPSHFHGFEPHLLLCVS